MMDEKEQARAIGKLEGRADGVDNRLDGMSDKVDDIHDIVMQSKGGIKMIIITASVCSSVGGIVGAFLTYLKFGK